MSSRSVVLADSNAAVRRLFKTILESGKFEVLEAKDGIEAIAVANRSTPAVVMLDVALPGLDGVAACKHLKGDQSTADIPVIMMGDRPNRETVVSAVKAGASDFVVKTGVSVATLLEKVGKLTERRAVEPRQERTGDPRPGAAVPPPTRTIGLATVEKKIDGLMAAKALPFLASEVLAVTADGGSSVRDLADVIERDQGVTAKILKFANSSYFSGEGRTTTIAQAVAKLGLNGIRDLVLGMSLVEDLGGSGGGSLDRFGFWRHSLAVGALADLFSVQVGLDDAEYCMVAGILHDLGKAIADDLFREEYGEVITRARSSDRFIRAHEKEVLGLDHSAIGGRVARNWRLPDSVVGTIMYHHRSWEEVRNLPSKYLPRLVTTVKLADTLVRASDTGFSGEYLLDAIPMEIYKTLGLKPEAVGGILDALGERLRSLEQVFMLHEGPPKDEQAKPDAGGARLLLLGAGSEMHVLEILLKSWNFDVTRAVSFPEDVAAAPPAAVVLVGGVSALNTPAAGSLLASKEAPKIVVVGEPIEDGTLVEKGIIRLRMPLHRERMLEALGLQTAPDTHSG